jgi:glycosyltransferase involved in cell wall biosynthesis
MKAGVIARWLKKSKTIPYIISEHSTHYKMSTHGDFGKRSIVHRRRVRNIFRDAAAATNVSAAFGNIIKEIFGLKHVHTIPNTVDTSIFNYKPVNNSKFRFIHVSTLTEPQKNIKGILKAVEKLSRQRDDFELFLVGPVYEELKQMTEQLRLDHLVTFTGEITYAEVARQMQQASAFVLFSRYENLPCVIIEALCCGLPVITSDVGGVREIINENNGILVQSGNEDQLIRSMNKMIDQYKNFKREQISKEAREKFEYSAIGKQFYSLYKQILSKN